MVLVVVGMGAGSRRWEVLDIYIFISCVLLVGGGKGAALIWWVWDHIGRSLHR